MSGFSGKRWGGLPRALGLCDSNVYVNQIISALQVTSPYTCPMSALCGGMRVIGTGGPLPSAEWFPRVFPLQHLAVTSDWWDESDVQKRWQFMWITSSFF